MMIYYNVINFAHHVNDIDDFLWLDIINITKQVKKSSQTYLNLITIV